MDLFYIWPFFCLKLETKKTKFTIFLRYLCENHGSASWFCILRCGRVTSYWFSESGATASLAEIQKISHIIVRKYFEETVMDTK